jgi:hypothetical protein
MFESRVLNAKRRQRDHNGKFTNKEMPSHCKKVAIPIIVPKPALR